MKKWIMVAAMALSMVVTAQQAEAVDSGVYTGIGVGAFGLEWSVPGGSQKNTVAGGFAKLGVNLNDFLAFELRGGLTANGTTNYTKGSISQKMSNFFSYIVKPQIRLSNAAEAYILLGGTTANWSLTVNALPGVVGTSAVSATGSTTKTGFTYGVGSNFIISNNVSAGVEWVKYWFNVDISRGTITSSVSMWGASATIDFKF